MSSPRVKEEAENLEFKWGKKRGVGGKKNEVQFYESFTFDGVEYNLDDCVYLFMDGQSEPNIGKMIRIWQNEDKSKKVKVIWFFRPHELINYVKNEDSCNKELFLACGEGVGLANVIPLESIAGKCNAVCISKDNRNPQPSEEEIRVAKFVFYRTFDVGRGTISDKIDDKIAGVDVMSMFNRTPKLTKEILGKTLPNSETSKTSVKLETVIAHKVLSKVKVDPGKGAGSSGKDIKYFGDMDSRSYKKAKVDSSVKLVEDRKLKHKAPIQNPSINRTIVKRENAPDINNKFPTKLKSDETKSRLSNDWDKEVKLEADEKVSEHLYVKLRKESNIRSPVDNKVDTKVMEVTTRPINKSRWFKQQPWDEKLQLAHKQETLVLLENLDPEYTSAEVKDIIWHGFKENCATKMIQSTVISSPLAGQAFVIFKTKDAAMKVVDKLKHGCLMLSNGRPLVGSFGTPCLTKNTSKLVGHLTINNPRFQNRDMRQAVSTAHCSQPNTIEYEMAMEWCLLHDRSERSWEKLCKRHCHEFIKVKENLKST